MAVNAGSGGSMATFWGQAEESFDAAIGAAVEAARSSLDGSTLEWMEVIEFRGGFEADGDLQYQVAIRVGYS